MPKLLQKADPFPRVSHTHFIRHFPTFWLLRICTYTVGDVIRDPKREGSKSVLTHAYAHPCAHQSCDRRPGLHTTGRDRRHLSVVDCASSSSALVSPSKRIQMQCGKEGVFRFLHMRSAELALGLNQPCQNDSPPFVLTVVASFVTNSSTEAL